MIHKIFLAKICSTRRTYLRLTALTALIISILGISFGFRARTWRVTAPTSAATQPDTKGETMQSASKRVEGEILTIQPNGFEPSQITRSSGLFVLAVDNRSEVEDLTLRLIRVNRLQEPALLDVTVPRERVNLDEYINLSPGNYVLTEANHPDWVCHITITAR